jgi:hypothetical protein
VGAFLTLRSASRLRRRVADRVSEIRELLVDIDISWCPCCGTLVPNEAITDSCSLGRSVTTDRLNKVHDSTRSSVHNRTSCVAHVLYSVISYVRYAVPEIFHDAPHAKQANGALYSRLEACMKSLIRVEACVL